ncbi:MAG TPA: hypothetical protein EYQ14_00010, partial [Gammaproteobacteria bacterium]|nr:hypothetical protein [Gammaproteobacteria bacterium]
MYATGNMGNVPMLFRDGTVIPDRDLMEVYEDTENYNAVPIILGTNRDEFKPFFIGDPNLIEMRMGVLPRIKNEPFFSAVTSYFNDSWKARGVDEVSIQLNQSQGSNVYAYRFDWDELPTILGADLSRLLGAPHAFEIPFVFNSFDNSVMTSVLFSDNNIPSRDALASKMSSYWAEFAYTGSPGRGRNGKQYEWRPWNPAVDAGKFVMLDGERD